jgi:hypothetical protein
MSKKIGLFNQLGLWPLKMDEYRELLSESKIAFSALGK